MEAWQVRNAKTLCKFIEEHTDYKKHGPHFEYGQMENGAFMSTLLNFLDDNPGAIEKLVEFMEESNMIPSVEDDE